MSIEDLNGVDKNVEFLSYNEETWFYSCIVNWKLVNVDELGNYLAEDGNIYPIWVDVKKLRDEAKAKEEEERRKAAAKARVEAKIVNKQLWATLNQGYQNPWSSVSSRWSGSSGRWWWRSWIYDFERRQDWDDDEE